jgi:hypothetical protein
MVFPCKFYNTEKGCRSNEEDCGHPHVLYCTNEICVKAGKQHTHTHATCGQKGGGAHEEFIAKKRETSMAEKAKKKAAETANVVTPVPVPNNTAAAELALAKNTVGEILYKQVLSFLTDDDNAGYKVIMECFPISLPPERIAGKTVGMLLEGLDLSELFTLKTDKASLQERVTEAVEVLHNYEKVVPPKK